ncbi:AraC family transcriptional regulator [Sphingobacteriaceae bacterium]|nr:AraC family transcriptional regulator [Sphingobacteriaceae bacterium]
MKKPSNIDNSIIKFVNALGKDTPQELTAEFKKFEIKVFEVYDFVPDLLLTIRSYIVKKNFKHRFENIKTIKNGIFFSFHNFFKDELDQNSSIRIKEELPHVKVIPMNSTQEHTFHKNTHMKHVGILICTDYLKAFLKEDAEKFAYLLSSKDSFVMEEFMSDDVLRIINEMVNSKKDESLSKFHFKLKAIELLYLLFRSLDKREQVSFQSLKPIEIENLYKVRDRLIAHLDIAPSLTELKAIACMNEIKLRKLFTQVFGMSIYDYFQLVRMKEAARLLKEAGKNVSEVGYDLGFTNLSHFSREFEKHIGVKPKKYQGSLMIS